MKLTVFLWLFCFTFSLSNAQTEVSGHITSNSVWSEANAPYMIVGNVYIDAGITLTIEPGTIIKFVYLDLQ